MRTVFPMNSLYAQSVSRALLPILAETPLPLSCLSRHEQACNFQTPGGALIALVTSRHGNGPFHIVLPCALPPLLTRDNHFQAQWQAGTLAIGPLQINLEHANIWTPDLPALQPLSFDALSWLHEVHTTYPSSPLYNGPATLRVRAQQGIAALQSGFTQSAEEQICRGVLALAGLGPGLTPAGDDFLVGFLAALHACRLQIAEEQLIFCQRIAQTAVNQTTTLSAQWLQSAGEGHFGEAWHQLITALNSNVNRAITTAAHRLLTTGATSGVDAMSGFLFGIDLVEDRRQKTEDRR
jgi:hypothetical protein